MDPGSTGSGAIRAGWTPVGGVTKRQRSTPTCQSGMQLFQVVAEVGKTPVTEAMERAAFGGCRRS